MTNIHIGIDFGTSQTKACIYNFEENEHEFFQFEKNNYFFPSRVVHNNNNLLFEYGNNGLIDDSNEEYRFFKMKSADDEQFHAVTYDDASKYKNSLYGDIKYKKFTSEFISVIYLTYVQLLIKEKYEATLKSNNKRSTGLIGSLLQRNKSTEDKIQFTTRIGIPTEWSQVNNLKRKQKFESILFLSAELQDKYKSLDSFQKVKSDDLILTINSIYDKYKSLSQKEFQKLLHQLGLSVYPETAAGLNFILKSKQLGSGYYAALDIGAGTSDLSFFRVNNGVLYYLASESYVVASNDVYKEYTKNIDSSAKLSQIQNHVEKLIRDNNIDENLNQALEIVNKKIESLVYRLFNKRVYYFRNDMVRNYQNQSIILYGGGSKLPKMKEDHVLIHDHGNRFSLNIERTYLNKIEIEKFTSLINIKSDNSSWNQVFPLLVVALGLSFINYSGDANWFDQDDYQPIDGGADEIEMIPHPRNQDCYIYNVLN